MTPSAASRTARPGRPPGSHAQADAGWLTAIERCPAAGATVADAPPEPPSARATPCILTLTVGPSGRHCAGWPLHRAGTSLRHDEGVGPLIEHHLGPGAKHVLEQGRHVTRLGVGKAK